VISTLASADSGVYQEYIEKLCPGAFVTVLPCPLFVPLVENGRVHRGDVVIETVAAEYLEPIRASGVDTLLLGCTHYPLLEDVIGDFMGPDVALIDSGAAVAESLKKNIGNFSEGREVATAFFVTDSTAQFEKLGPLFLKNSTFGAVQRVDILAD
jgi:glutamate racemase